MNREEKLRLAIKRSMKPVTRQRVVNDANFAAHIRQECVPHAFSEGSPGPDNAAHPDWWDGTIAEKGLRWFPGCVKKIRAEFKRLNEPA